jgi:Asp/Glu/hydantoin racemase
MNGETMVTLEFHDPSGTLEVTQPFAPRLDTLEGKRIGIVTNDQWQAYRTLPKIKELLEADFKGIEVLPLDAYPQGNLLIGTEETAEAVKKSGVDAVVVGSAS